MHNAYELLLDYGISPTDLPNADYCKVIGVENLDETQKKIADIITTQILPNPQEFITLGTQYIDGKNVIVINVRKGKALYYIKKYGRSASGCYIRVGTSCRSMTEDQIEKEYISYLQIPERTMKSELSPRQNLTFNQFKTLLSFKNVHYQEITFDINYNLRNNSGKYNYLAFLLSDQNDTSIKVVRFNGITKSDFISRKEFENGCILKQMEEALEYTLNVLNIIQTHVVGGTRIDTPYFDGIAFREAWYNAVCHNLWVEHIPPAIYGFDDRIEIISQGLLKSGMTQEEFFAGVSKPINEEFAKIFMQMHYMEQSGRGVPTVISHYGKQAYHFGSSFIQCVFPYNIIDTQKNNKLTGKDVGVNVGVNVGVKLTKTEEKVLALILEKEEMTADQMARVIQVTSRTIERALKALKEKGYLVRRGTDKVGYWEVISKGD